MIFFYDLLYIVYEQSSDNQHCLTLATSTLVSYSFLSLLVKLLCYYPQLSYEGFYLLTLLNSLNVIAVL